MGETRTHSTTRTPGRDAFMAERTGGWGPLLIRNRESLKKPFLRNGRLGRRLRRLDQLVDLAQVVTDPR
ncbi:MAG: hypothetical protein NVS2B6_09240 [Thermoleophilaceae bacterium]